MRRPSARLTPNQVRIRRVTRWDQDATAGRLPVWGPTTGPHPCAVHPSSAEDVPANLREAEVIYCTVQFYDDPLVRIRDELHWDGRVLTVTGVRPSAAGRGRTYLVDCEERPVHGPR